MIKKLPVKLTVLAVAAMKFGLLQLGLMQPIQAVEVCTAVSSQGKASEGNHCQLEFLVQQFEKMSLLDAKEVLKDAALDQEALKDAFVLAQQNKNAVAMAVLANQFKVLKGGDDVLSHLAPLQVKGKNDPKFDKKYSKFKNSLEETLSEMIKQSQKCHRWSKESIRLTENVVAEDAQCVVETIMKPFLTAYGKNGIVQKSASKDLFGTDYVRLLAQISKFSND